jgi:undecaprenyl diphosphate synthase
VRLRAVGDVSLLPEDVQKILRDSEKETEKYEGKGINVAVAYGSRDEIVHAVNRAVARGEKVTEESFARLLYTADVPDPDLVIRTGKEVRLSNFLLYQSAYAELYFSNKMFPDFSDRELDKAILSFSGRTRRFGKTDEQIKKS